MAKRESSHESASGEPKSVVPHDIRLPEGYEIKRTRSRTTNRHDEWSNELKRINVDDLSQLREFILQWSAHLDIDSFEESVHVIREKAEGLFSSSAIYTTFSDFLREEPARAEPISSIQYSIEMGTIAPNTEDEHKFSLSVEFHGEEALEYLRNFRRPLTRFGYMFISVDYTDSIVARNMVSVIKDWYGSLDSADPLFNISWANRVFIADSYLADRWRRLLISGVSAVTSLALVQTFLYLGATALNAVLLAVVLFFVVNELLNALLAQLPVLGPSIRWGRISGIEITRGDAKERRKTEEYVQSSLRRLEGTVAAVLVALMVNLVTGMIFYVLE